MSRIILAIITLSLILNYASCTTAVSVKAGKDTAYGDYLTDGNGIALYMFQNDSAGMTNCYTTCAVAWPPLTVASGATAAAGTGVTASMLGVITRTDGTKQVTYNGWPLYYYTAELATKSTIVGCQGITGSGGLWFIMNPNGKVNFTTKGRTANLASKNTLEMATNTNLGVYLTDKDGVALYVFGPDSFLKSNCADAQGCIAAWPPLTVATGSTPTFGTGVDGSLVYWIKRADGTIQVTYNGWPLYYYVGEIGKPGTINCQNKNMNGGFWWIIKNDGTVIKTDASGPVTKHSTLLTYGLGAFLVLLALLY